MLAKFFRVVEFIVQLFDCTKKGREGIQLIFKSHYQKIEKDGSIFFQSNPSEADDLR